MSELTRAFGTFTDSNNRQGTIEAQFPAGTLQWRPMLRAAVGYSDRSDESPQTRFETHNNGDIRLSFFFVDGDWGRGQICSSWLTGLFASIIAEIDEIESATDEHGVEYGIEASMRTKSDTPIMLMNWHDLFLIAPDGSSAH